MWFGCNDDVPEKSWEIDYCFGVLEDTFWALVKETTLIRIIDIFFILTFFVLKL